MDFPGIFSSGWIAKAVNRGRFLDSLSTNSGNWKRVDIFVCLEMRGPQNLLGRSSNSASWFWFLEGFYVGNRQQKVDFHPWVCRQNHFLHRFMGTRTSSPKSTPLIFSCNWEGHHPEIETADHLNVVFGDLNGTSEPTVGSLCPPSTESTEFTQKLCHLFMKEFWNQLTWQKFRDCYYRVLKTSACPGFLPTTRISNQCMVFFGILESCTSVPS